MIEILNILFQSIFIFILFLFPSNLIKFQILKKFNFFDKVSINLILQISIYFLFSFINLKIFYILYFIFFLNIFLIIKNKFSIFFEEKVLFNLSLFIIFFISISFSLAATPTLGWDAIAHWFWKAQVFYQGGNLQDFKSIPYEYYPHLGTYLWSLFWKISLLEFEYLGRIIFIFLFLNSIFSLLNDITNKKNFVLLLAIVYLSTDFFVLSGYQEYLIFSFLCFSARLIYLLKEEDLNLNLFIILILLTLNLIIWSKQEGIFVTLLLLLTIIFFIKMKSLKKLLFLIIYSFLILFHILLEIKFKGSYGFHEPVSSGLIERLLKFDELFNDIVFITQHLIIALIQRPIFLTSIFISIYLIFTKRNFMKEKAYFFSFLFFIIMFIYAIFLHTRFPLESMLGPVMDRLILQFSGFFIIIFLYLIKYEKKD